MSLTFKSLSALASSLLIAGSYAADPRLQTGGTFQGQPRSEPRQSSGLTVPVVKRIATEQTTRAIHRRLKIGEGTVDSRWLMPIGIGTPPQVLNFLPDSGANDFTTQSTLLPASLLSPEVAWDPSKSTTARQSAGATYQEFYNDYNDSGVVYLDTVTLGGTSFPNIYICTMNNASEKRNDKSGNIGLDLTPSLSSTPALPAFLPAVRASLDAGLYAVDYNAATRSGVFDFGFINGSRYTGFITYAPSIQPQGFFEVTTRGFYVGSTFKTYQWNIIVDTGTGDSRVPQAVADAYFASIAGSSYDAGATQYLYPCSTTLPNFVIALSAGGNVTWPSWALASTNSPDGGAHCYSELKVSSDDTTLFGDTFIESNYVVFDYDNKRVGFANKPKPV